MSRIIRIGSRRSPLAQAQVQQVKQALLAAHGWDEARIEIVLLKTRGDEISDAPTAPPLADMGGKGLFTDIFEQGLRADALDLAVHSLKDLPAQMPSDLMLACVPPRADARDALILPNTQKGGLDSLPPTARIGTSSLRRKAQILAHMPDARLENLRGNIATRLAKLQQHKLDAIVLAVAGLERLGMMDKIAAILPPDIMLPAVGQGALGLQIRADDTAMQTILAPLHCPTSAACVTAERAFLAALGGSCHTPIAAFAQCQGDMLTLTTRLLAPDGQDFAEITEQGAASSAETLGRQLGAAMHKTAPHLIAALPVLPADKDI